LKLATNGGPGYSLVAGCQVDQCDEAGWTPRLQRDKLLTNFVVSTGSSSTKEIKLSSPYPDDHSYVMSGFSPS